MVARKIFHPTLSSRRETFASPGLGCSEDPSPISAEDARICLSPWRGEEQRPLEEIDTAHPLLGFCKGPRRRSNSGRSRGGVGRFAEIFSGVAGGSGGDIGGLLGG